MADSQHSDKSTKPDELPRRKPDWLKVSGFSGRGYEQINHLLRQYGLNTVCQAANCPNRGECFNRGTATFLIMGPRCTRNCRFCDVQPGRPAPLDPSEPENVAAVSEQLKLKHVVVTSVTRDDLPDGGTAHFAATVAAIRERLPAATVEILTPDFKKVPEAVDRIIEMRPDVFNHNIETVPRLYRSVRPAADYRRSLDLLAEVGRRSEIVTKSGLMVGLGEERSEMLVVFADLARAGVKLLTIGQYLAPSKEHHPVVRYVTPDEFDDYGREAKRAGIPQVFSAPLVRSSYKAEAYNG